MMNHWRYGGASVIGDRPHNLTQCCQDYHAIITRNSMIIIAVADGAGSAENGLTGARTSVTTMMNSLNQSDLTSSDLTQAFITTRKTLVTLAANKQVPVNSLATTLLVAVLTENKIIAGQIGDGAIIVYDQSETRLLTRPIHGEYINETRFITDNNFEDHLQITTTDNRHLSLALFTDGLEPVCLHNNNVYSPFFTGLFGHLQNESDLSSAIGLLLANPRFKEKLLDDCTLAIAIPTREKR